MLLGQGRLRAARSVRLLHGARRRRAAGRVRDAALPGRPAVRSRPSKVSTPHARDGSSARSSRPADRSAASARPASSCACLRRARARPRSRARRAPVPVHRLAHGVRRALARDAASRRRADGSRPRAPRRGAPSSRVASRRWSAPTFRSAVRRSPTTPRPRDALVAVPLPPGSTAELVEAARAALGRRATRWPRLGVAAGKVQGRRTTAQEAPAAARRAAACPPGGVRLATSWVEPAYLEPGRVVVRARWCSRHRRYVNGGAFGGKLAISGAGRGAASSPIGSIDVVRVVYSAKTSCASARSVRRSRRPRVWRDGRVEIDGVVARGGADCVHRRAWPSPYACWRSTRAGARSTSPVRRSVATLRAAGLAEHRGARRGRARRGRRRPRGAHRRSDACSTRACAVAVGRERGRAGAHRSRHRGARRASRCGSRPATRSTRSCCVRTRSARRTWRWAGCCTESLTVDPETGEVHDLTIRSFGILRAKDMPPVDIDVDRRRPRAARRRRPTRCSPRSRPPRGTRSPAPRARGRIRSRPVETRASRRLRR